LKEAKEKLDIMKLSDEERREYDDYLENLHYQASMFESSYKVGEMRGKKEGKKEGIEVGKKEGIEVGKKEGIEVGKKEGIEVGKKEGIEVGKEVGAKDKAIEMAKKLKEKGIDIAVISETSGLPPEEIAKL
ncbi:MAG: hypothetical protein NT166_24900, partial [Candidatus Aminicenantes bacterium]|nr:hypothetical protein [Candidatus Aminicenantes bacterium]